MRRTAADRIKGDPTQEALVESMIRVDHAGEYGAVRIYQGQLAVLGRTPAGDAIREMADQEARHLQGFDKLVGDRRVRPTALQPLWHVAGYALGAATALLGPKAAMACTQAVEEVIDEHYADQAARLGDEDPQLRDMIEDYRADEIAHRDRALAAGAEEAPAHGVLTEAIKAGSRLAIWLSSRF
jgi:ubiquinone biosynthesis monooxygenase Coq7